jgi:hypothetical protein
VRDDFDLGSYSSQADAIHRHWQQEKDYRSSVKAANAAMQARRAWVRNKSPPTATMKTTVDGETVVVSAVAAIHSPISIGSALQSLSVVSSSLPSHESTTPAQPNKPLAQFHDKAIADQDANDE